MRKQISILIATIGLPYITIAQNELDALRLGQTNGAATARNISLGGVGGATGADFSALSVNPAGIGVYRSSEYMVTPTLRLNGMNTNYLGTSDSENNTKFNLSNFGMVFTKAQTGANYNSSKWKAASIAIGYNRVADFNSRGYYSGNNKESSFSEMFAADAIYNGRNAFDAVPPLGYLGYESYLTDDYNISNAYENIIRNGGSVNQSKSWNSKGGINEWFLGFGGNYDEKLMLGANISLVSYRYEADNLLQEKDATGNPNNDFESLAYNELLTTSGIGVNVKLGAIYVVNEQLRLGASFHSPTWSALTDVSDYSITTNTEGYKASLGGVDANPVTTVQPPNAYQFDYSLRSPWRAVLGATYFIGKKGFIAADYEYAAYNSMKFGFNNDFRDYERQVNQSISNTFKGTHNLRLGGEAKLSNEFAARAGFAYYGSPFKDADIFRGQRMDFSVGIGYRFSSMFVDLGYMYTMRQVSEFAHPVLFGSSNDLGVRRIPVGVADINYGNSMVALTIGFKFNQD